jgi:hypothetical protein
VRDGDGGLFSPFLGNDVGVLWLSSGSRDTSYGGGEAWGHSSGGQLSGVGVTTAGRWLAAKIMVVAGKN